MTRKSKPGVSRRSTLALMGAGAVTFATPCVARAQAKTIKIGMPTILSGRVAQLGTSSRNGVMNYTGRGGHDVDPNRTFMPTGQGAGLIHEIKPAAEVFADLLRETEAALRKAQQLMSGDPARQHSAAPSR